LERRRERARDTSWLLFVRLVIPALSHPPLLNPCLYQDFRVLKFSVEKLMDQRRQIFATLRQTVFMDTPEQVGLTFCVVKVAG